MLHLQIRLTAFLLLMMSSSFGQNILKGLVTDAETQTALPGVTIFIPDLKKGTFTNEAGAFSIDDLPKGKFLVEVKLIGYTAIVQRIEVSGVTEFNISLTSVVTELNEVVVTGISNAAELKRNPIPITTINNQALTENASTNLIDNIAATPGISQISTGSAISKPVIRGLSYNRIITVLDGIRQEGQQWGDEHGIEIDEFAIERVEVIKGAGSLMYGGDGLGGVVHFLTPSPVAVGSVVGNWKSNYQSNNGLFGNSLMVAGNQKGIYWSGRASNKIARAYTNKYDGRVFNSGFHETNFSGTAGINKKWGYTELSAGTFNQEIGLVEGDRDENGNFIRMKNLDGNEEEATVTHQELTTYSLFVPRQTIRHSRISSTSNIYFGESRIQLNLGYQRNQRKEFGDVLQANEAELFFDLSTLNYNLIYFLPWGNAWQFSIGTSGLHQQNKNKGEEFIIPEYTSFDWGAFGFAKRTVGKLDVAGGFRYDRRTIRIESLYLDDNDEPTNDPNATLRFEKANLEFSNLSASAGVTYEFSDVVTGKLNASRGFRAPNISELASNGKHEGTLRYEYGSYKLQAETSFQLDASVLLNSEHITAEVAVFQNTIDHYIYAEKLLAADGTDSIPDPLDPVPAYAYVQGKAQLRGGEVSIDFHPHPLDWLHFENAFSFVQGVNLTRQKTREAKYLPFIPAPRWQSELRANVNTLGKSFSGSFMKVEYIHYWKQNQVLLEGGTETPTPAYSLWNVGLGTGVISKKGTNLFSIYFTVTNVFNKAYQHHLSRLKYAAENPVSGRTGVFNMGRNFNVKIIVPVTFVRTKD
jgi:iron complex outermembrane recepter protein